MSESNTFHMFPQGMEGASYYNYGTPAAGQGQYGKPRLLSFLFFLEFLWGGMDDRKLGIGNMSLRGGGPFPDHNGHQFGLDVDIRPLRKDGLHLPVRYQDKAYDRAATRKLVDLIWQTGMVSVVYFNDPLVSRVRYLPTHDNHLHVSIFP